MPNNCSTLIQRKQNAIHKTLRTNSDGKIQNAVNETTAELRTTNAQKNPVHSSSPNNITNASRESSAIRRSNLFASNRFQSNSEYNNAAHLPSIRDGSASAERQNHFFDSLQTIARPKTPLSNASPKSYGRPTSASISSLYNTMAKRSTENFINFNGDIDELILPSSRHSRRPTNENKHVNGANQTISKEAVVPQKRSIENVIDTRYSSTPRDNQQQRGFTPSSRLRSAVPTYQVETHTNETAAKERANAGQIYQRRTNNTIKAPIKQKIDKYRRRSEEATQATNGHNLMITANAGLSATAPALGTASSSHLKTSPSPASTRRVTSDAEIQARLDVLRLSMNSNLGDSDHLQQQQQRSPPQSQQQLQQNSRNRLKSPYLYATHQQLAAPSTPQTPAAGLRRNQTNANNSFSNNRQTNTMNYRRLQQTSVKQTSNNNPGNLYLAFIASRHLSTLDDPQLEYDMDHPKLLRIFTWIKNVEENRNQMLDHDKLIVEQNQRMLDHEDDLSLYSEIQYAVDDLPANTTGKPCEKIAPMSFDD